MGAPVPVFEVRENAASDSGDIIYIEEAGRKART
jgi:hypothetical protein